MLVALPLQASGCGEGVAVPEIKPKQYPTSIRLPIDLKKDIDTAREEQRYTQSDFIVEILRQWQKFWRSERKFKK